MSILIGFLSVLLVLDCLFLILLILIQLPKKEAGAGVAFGGGATEALFGAGSGTVLTKVTKYAAGIFMGMSLVLAIINAQYARSNAQSLELELERTTAEAGKTAAPGSQPSGTPEAAAPLLQSSATNLIPDASSPASNPAPANAESPANPDAPADSEAPAGQP